MRKFTLLTLFMLILGPTSLIPVNAQDLVYVAVDPCRIVDTRNAGGAIPANDFRNFRVSGTVGQLAVQGGTTNCLDPKAGTGLKPLAVTAYVVAVPAKSSTSGGVLTAYPSDQLPPPVGTGSTVNFAAGQVIGNTTTITLCDPAGSCPTGGEFAILARNTNQHVVIDVQGYFYPIDALPTTLVVLDSDDKTVGVGVDTGYISQNAANARVFFNHNDRLFDLTIIKEGFRQGTVWYDQLNCLGTPHVSSTSDLMIEIGWVHGTSVFQAIPNTTSPSILKSRWDGFEDNKGACTNRDRTGNTGIFPAEVIFDVSEFTPPFRYAVAP